MPGTAYTRWPRHGPQRKTPEQLFPCRAVVPLSFDVHENDPEPAGRAPPPPHRRICLTGVRVVAESERIDRSIGWRARTVNELGVYTRARVSATRHNKRSDDKRLVRFVFVGVINVFPCQSRRRIARPVRTRPAENIAKAKRNAPADSAKQHGRI